MTHPTAGTDHQIQSTTLKTPGGGSVSVLHPGHGTVLVGTDTGGSKITVVVQGGPSGGVSENIIGDIWDAVTAVAGKIKGLLSCTPVQTTTVTVGPDGKVTSIVTTNTCVAN